MGGYHGGKTLQERFDEKWDEAPNGCRNWRFVKNTASGPRANTFCLAGKVTNAHRASWILTFGPIPEGQVVRHKCDNAMCVNPEHLELGTHADNNADTRNRGRTRQPRGERHGQSVLTSDDVRRVRAEMINAPRGTLARLSREFGVNKSTLLDVIAGRTWTHIA